MDVLKYEITYKVVNDIPINPEWIKDQIRAAVGKLQAEIDKKNLHGQHVLEFKCNISDVNIFNGFSTAISHQKL